MAPKLQESLEHSTNEQTSLGAMRSAVRDKALWIALLAGTGASAAACTELGVQSIESPYTAGELTVSAHALTAEDAPNLTVPQAVNWANDGMIDTRMVGYEVTGDDGKMHKVIFLASYTKGDAGKTSKFRAVDCGSNDFADGLKTGKPYEVSTPNTPGDFVDIAVFNNGKKALFYKGSQSIQVGDIKLDTNTNKVVITNLKPIGGFGAPFQVVPYNGSEHIMYGGSSGNIGLIPINGGTIDVDKAFSAPDQSSTTKKYVLECGLPGQGPKGGEWVMVRTISSKPCRGINGPTLKSVLTAKGIKKIPQLGEARHIFLPDGTTMLLIRPDGSYYSVVPKKPVDIDAGGSDADAGAQPDTTDTTSTPDTTQPDTAQPDTTQPDTSQPDTSQPDTSQPDTSQPDTSQPDTSQPDTSQPDTSQPDTSQPDTSQPDTSQPDTSQPDTSQPDIAQPDTSQPDTSQPDTSQPDTSQPDTSQPDTSQPDTSQPDTSQPDTSQPDTNSQEDTSKPDMVAAADGQSDASIAKPKPPKEDPGGICSASPTSVPNTQGTYAMLLLIAAGIMTLGSRRRKDGTLENPVVDALEK